MVVTFILVGIILFSAVAYLFYQNQKLSEKITSSVTKTENSNSNPTINPQSSLSPQANKSLSNSPTSTLSKKPVIVYEAEGSIPAADKTGIQSRIVDPFIDYNINEVSQPMASITISPNNNPSKTEYPYLFSAVFESGGNQGFVIGKKDGQISWWIPECLNGCQFSNAFKEKYPEIVSLAN